MLAKTDPNKFGSDVAQKEYNLATNIEGLSDQERLDIQNALGKNFIGDRSSQVVTEAVSNPLVSGDTVYRFDKDSKDRQLEKKNASRSCV